MKLENYIGEYIENENALDYQSTNLVSDYVDRLTDGRYKPLLNAKYLKHDKIPENWNVYKNHESLVFKRGDIFVTDNKLYGFNGIVLDKANEGYLSVISMNLRGDGLGPVQLHDYKIIDVTYIVRPDLETLIDKGIAEECENIKQNKEIVINEKYAVKINDTMILQSVSQPREDYLYTFTDNWENAYLLTEYQAQTWADKLGGRTVKVTRKLSVGE